MTVEHIVICQQLTNAGTDYYFDGRRFSSREEAIDHGFRLGRSDDFNVALLTDGRLTWFGWMNEPLADYPLAEIAQQIGVQA